MALLGTSTTVPVTLMSKWTPVLRRRFAKTYVGNLRWTSRSWPLLQDQFRTTTPAFSQHEATTSSTAKMLSRTAMRLPNTVARRGFSTTRAQFNSPYHYPEGPRSSIPFNPLTRFFALRYWGFMGLGFGLPFGIAAWQTYKNQ
ncbi:hypothetical protein KC356_g3091 [Hortaea werneckii]|nr:hypothetical protein KC356_g3091 [Hortaea werneckii]